MYTYVVRCPSLTNPDNGTINCLLGNDDAFSYGDTCNFTCNTGYELAGSDTRTCQSDGSWSGSDDVCRIQTFTCTYSQNIATSYVAMYV